MLRWIPWLFTVLVAAHLPAAELLFDFSQSRLNESPRGFRSTVSGKGQPGIWKIIEDEVPSAFASVAPNSRSLVKRQVLAQLSGDITDEHFPLLLYEDDTFGDFTLTTRFKNVSGAIEQMAGVAFRVEDEKNYYYVRASSLGNTFRFFKLVNGERGEPIGPEVEIPKGVWHELTVECKGNRIRCLFNGKEVFPALTDNSFSAGKIGFWTKSDSIAHFVDTKIIYTPRENLAQLLVREMQQKFPRLLGLKIYALARDRTRTQVIASSDAKEIGRAGEEIERNVIERGSVYYGKSEKSVSVTLPLHDRNGDPAAAVRVTMQSFAGQTEQNAVARALPIIKQMEARVRSATELIE